MTDEEKLLEDKPQQSHPETSGPIPRPMELAVGSTAQPSPTLPTTGRIRYLLGFMDPPMLAQALQGGALTLNPPAEAALLQRHALAMRAREQLSPIDLTPSDIVPVSGAANEAWMREVAAHPMFQGTFATGQVVVARVPIAKLTGFQPFLKSLHVPVPTDDDEILRWCIPKEFRTEYQIMMLPAAGGLPRIVFTTDDPTSSFTVGAGGDGAILSLAPRGNWVQVAITEGRFVVRNGYHRIAALAALGHTTVPVLVTNAPTIENVIADGPGWFAPPYLRSLPRPPLVTDFLDPDLCVELSQPSRKRVFEVRLAVSEIPVIL